MLTQECHKTDTEHSNSREFRQLIIYLIEIRQLNLDTNLTIITMLINIVFAQWFNRIKSLITDLLIKILLSELIRIQPVHLREDKPKLRYRNVQLQRIGITETLTDPVSVS